MGSFDLEVLVESETRGFESWTKKGFFSSNRRDAVRNTRNHTVLGA